MVGTIVVLGGLFLLQGRVVDWVTDDETVDEADIVAANDDDVTILPVENSCDPWLPTFEEDFEGDSIDGNSWIVFNSPAANGNGMRSAEAVTVADGTLVITAQMVDGELVTGGVASNHQQTFGRIEARVRTEVDPTETMTGTISSWPAGNDHPDGGQIEIYQSPPGGDREPFYSYVHQADNAPEEFTHRAAATDWQELAFEWDLDQITVYRDGQALGTVTNDEAVPTVPHVLTIQLIADQAAMEEAGEQQVRMFVDWVRFFQQNESPGSSC